MLITTPAQWADSLESKAGIPTVYMESQPNCPFTLAEDCIFAIVDIVSYMVYIYNTDHWIRAGKLLF